MNINPIRILINDQSESVYPLPKKSANFDYQVMDIVDDEEEDSLRVKLSQTKKSTPSGSEGLLHLLTTAEEQLALPSTSLTAISSRGITMCRTLFERNVIQWKKEKEVLEEKKKELCVLPQQNIVELNLCNEALKQLNEMITIISNDLNIFNSEGKKRKQMFSPIVDLGLTSSSSSLSSSASLPLSSEIHNTRKRKSSSPSESSSERPLSVNSLSSESSTDTSSSPTITIEDSFLTSLPVKKKRRAVDLKYQSIESIEEMLENAGINNRIKKPNEKKLTASFIPLYQKIKSSEPLSLEDIKKYFSENNVDENSYQGGWSVLHYLVKYKQVSVLKEFLKEFKPEIKTEDGWNALQIICVDSEPSEKTTEIFKILLDKYGIEIIDLKNPHGIDALSLAAYYGNAIALEVMIPYINVITHLDKDGFSPIHYACMNLKDHPKLLTILQRNKTFKIELPGLNGKTPFMLAALSQKEKIVEKIINYMGYINDFLKDNEGYTVIDHAKKGREPFKKKRKTEMYKKARRIMRSLEKHIFGETYS